MKDTLRLVIALTTICVVAAFALAMVYDVTKAPIAESLRKEKLAAIEAVLPEHDNQPDKEVQSIVLGKDKKGREQRLDFYIAKKEEQWVGTAFTSSAKGFGGKIVLMLGLSPDNNLVKVKVLQHKETPGLGAKIEREAFISQCVGKSLKSGKLKVTKDGGDIDAITGATISSRAVCDAVNNGLLDYAERFSKPDDNENVKLQSPNVK